MIKDECKQPTSSKLVSANKINESLLDQHQFNSSSDQFFANRFDSLIEKEFEIDQIVFKDHFLESNKYLSQLVKGEGRVMMDKKLQCEISVGSIMDTSSSFRARDGKMRKLLILKVIKLVRLLLKEARLMQKQTKETLLKQREICLQLQQDMRVQMQALLEKFNHQLHLKQSKIVECEWQLSGLREQNEKLRQNYEYVLGRLQQQNAFNLHEIDSIHSTSDQKLQRLYEKSSQLQQQNKQCQRQLNLMGEMLNNSQIQIKKLQYEKRQLVKENTQLRQQNDELIRFFQQNQQMIKEECENITDSSEYIVRIAKLNQSYVNQLSYTKKELKKQQQANEDLKKDYEEIMSMEMAVMQENFDKKMQALKLQHQQELKLYKNRRQTNENEIDVIKPRVQRNQLKHQTVMMKSQGKMDIGRQKENIQKEVLKKRVSRPSRLLQENLTMKQSWFKVSRCMTLNQQNSDNPFEQDD